MTIAMHPEKWGLTVVGEIDWTEKQWEFDVTVAWRDRAGTYYWGDDAGCSCPLAFEWVESLSQLQSGTLEQLKQHLTREARRRNMIRTEQINRLTQRSVGA